MGSKPSPAVPTGCVTSEIFPALDLFSPVIRAVLGPQHPYSSCHGDLTLYWGFVQMFRRPLASVLHGAHSRCTN